jgi:hypothetical protein
MDVWELSQRDEIALAEGLCELGRKTLAEGLRDWGRCAVSPFQFDPDICLTNEKKHGKP